MEEIAARLFADLLIVLGLGILSGSLCRRFGISLMVGYMCAGVLVGEGGLHFLSPENHELEYLARAGALFLLFSVGIEFSLEELRTLSRYFFVGGPIQMVLVALPVSLLARWLGLNWQAALLLGFCVSLSSTVLVFKGLSEWGHLTSSAGRRAIGILLFQDVALVPLILVIPLVTGVGQEIEVSDILWLGLKSAAFVCVFLMAHRLVSQLLIEFLVRLKSTELLVLFSLAVLLGLCVCAAALGLPPAIGALAAGMVLSGNRLSKQIDSLVLPYRESFAAIFFVTLGALLKPQLLLEEPVILTIGFLSIFLIKAIAAGTALRTTGLGWKASFAAGVGLAQLGEFSFVLLSEGLRAELFSQADYNRTLFIALGTLLVTPQLIKVAFRFPEKEMAEPKAPAEQAVSGAGQTPKVLVIGIGPIGRQIVSRLETLGMSVTLVDLSPVNLYPFAQQGFYTICGDALDPNTLSRANLQECRLVAITVPDDTTAAQISKLVRDVNSSTYIVLRCRYVYNVTLAKKSGADVVISEERLAAGEMLQSCVNVLVQE